MRKAVFSAIALLLSGATVPAAAVMIDFNSQATGLYNGALVTPEATFTSSTGKLYFGAAGGDKALCTFAGSTCAASLTIDFIGPVSNLSFMVDADESIASSLFVTGTTLTGAMAFTAGGLDGLPGTYDLVDLSQFEGITSLTLSSNDPKGLGYDHFSFEPALTAEPGSGSTVPEPASWALMLTGLGLVGSSMRRRSRNVVTA